MSKIEFSKEERSELERRIQDYMQSEFDMELTSFESGFLLDFISREIGPVFYNRALYDAEAVISKRAEEMGEAVLSLEQT